MAFDDAYGALTDHDDDARWAYGTGFTDPLAGVPAGFPEGVDRAGLAAYCLMLGDDALIMSHRLQQWVTRAPELEDEMALANIGLDLLGQARLLLARAGEAEGAGRDEDDLAYRRDPHEFRNVRLAERADADFAHLIARLLVLTTWRLALFDRLAGSRDPMLAAIAAKGVKELTYHRDYAARWTVRLGDGTALSHERMTAAVAEVLPPAAELFQPHQIELSLAAAGVAVDPATLRAEFDTVLAEVLTTATIDVAPGFSATAVGSPAATPGSPAATAGSPAAAAGSPETAASGRDGEHTEALGGILAEMQGLARAVPGGAW
ncbi:1,2-phenylacetyl-CoA epoxidase subunit PaaC [Actinoplanes siamensis]|uniref:Phenylacetate-CoA oxygenase subunit PaaI n=1 Tax=Actinoplanes siamensis TaxID=1223317 RepID=A0A919THV9_9ACTN|nr:1,2-phenylacetyl-CoA epoxidase subunit PaaC [Actinoplanes siamensis]GIF03742.1 phenylacetate-CoA oxygenase subunit PaaI [Actinoplanes siamensis]